MITEDLDLFFDDFGVSFTAGAISGKCLKDMPGVSILDDQVLSVDAVVLVKTSEFGHLIYNNAVAIGGEPYIVKQPAMPVEDGAFSLIILEKVINTPHRLVTQSGEALATLDLSQLVTT